MTMNCISKTEGDRKLIQGFQNLSKDGRTERRKVSKYVTKCANVQPQLNLFITHCEFHFFQSLLAYAAVYQ